MSVTDNSADLLPSAPLSRAAGIVRRFLWIYGTFAAGLILFIIPAIAPGERLAKMKAMAQELLTGGLGLAALSAVLLALTVLTAIGLLTSSRLALRRAEVTQQTGELDTELPTLLGYVWRLGPGLLAREGQAIVTTLGAVIIALLAWLLWPAAHVAGPQGSAGNLVAALVIGLAFPSLIAERMASGVPPEQMPEAAGLRRILLIVTIVLGLSGAAEIGRSLGFGWIHWVQRGLAILVLLHAIELAVRGLARLFLPRPTVDVARAVSESVLAALITGGPRAPGQLIRTHLGIDFARSWALRYLIAAAFPAVVATLLFCWLLSGVKLLNSDQRGVYERLGAPIKVLGPGFHVLMPWPLGRLRPVEYGTIHTIAIGANQGPDAFMQDEKTQKVGAEDTPTAAMNRLWETAHATEAEYLVASQAMGGQQNFQAVNTEILVLYRTGMTDQAAWSSVYSTSDPAALVEQEASRLATQYFSSHSLDEVMGGQRDALQGQLRAQLARAIDANHAGIEIMSVLINEVHPPAGAATAYHNVQANAIKAQASVFQANAHATRTAGKSQQEARQLTSSASAGAVEKIQAAGGNSYQFDADRKAYRLAPPAFLQERRARNLIQALRGARLTVLDSHLSGDQVPFIDMRQTAGAAPASAGGAPPSKAQSEAFAPDALPSTSSEKQADD